MRIPARLSFVFTFFLFCILNCVPTQSQKDEFVQNKVLKYVQSVFLQDPGVVFAGLPKPNNYPNKIKVLDKGDFTIGYDEVRKCPVWVMYKVTPDDDYLAPKRPSHFETDFATESKVRSEDYTHSGFDRGHMAPNFAIASRYGRATQLETFKMSNVAPQKSGLNRGIWKDLEMLEAEKGGYGDRLKTIWVICGCIWDNDKTFVAGKIEIPDAFFKIIIDLVDGHPRVLAFVIPQIPPKKYLTEYLKSVDEIEFLAHIDVMSEIDDLTENELEVKQPKALW